MYQWFETEDRKETPAGASDGDHDGHVDTTYSYDLGWFDHRIDSESFFNPLGGPKIDFYEQLVFILPQVITIRRVGQSTTP